VDTNVWISGLHFASRQGVPTKALRRAIEHDRLATCAEIETEILRVVIHKFKWEHLRAAETVKQAFARANRVAISGNVAVCRDPNDNMFLECAERANADIIVAGDKDLLVLRNFGRARIITPAEYLYLPYESPPLIAYPE
jgi:putative PIN family toxin of toxin-antitoxin system